MAKYYADCEFESSTGRLLSLGMVSPSRPFSIQGKALYMVDVVNASLVEEEWLKVNVLPHLEKSPPSALLKLFYSYTEILVIEGFVKDRKEKLSKGLWEFLKDDKDITIVVDWPEDIKYISDLILTGPGTMIDIPSFKFEVKRVDAYPSSVVDCIQHNAIGDAFALLTLCEEMEQKAAEQATISKLSPLVITLLKVTKEPECDTSIDALRKILEPMYSKDMTFMDLITVLTEAYCELLKVPLFECGGGIGGGVLQAILESPVAWYSRHRVNNRLPLTLETQLSVVAFYQPIITRMLNAFRLARVDWCADQLK